MTDHASLEKFKGKIQGNSRGTLEMGSHSFIAFIVHENAFSESLGVLYIFFSISNVVVYF